MMQVLQKECTLTHKKGSNIMSSLQIQHFISEVENLCEEDKLQVISIILDSLRSSPRKAMDDEMVLNLFNKFNGCVKSETQVDCRKEMNDYLDERYGA